jgi:hypothetical protein
MAGPARTFARSCLVIAAIGALFVLAEACKSSVATPEECDKAADHLAELKVAQEKQPKVVQFDGSVRGGLLLPPFGDPSREKEVREDARKAFRDRCGKGWKRATWDCMMAAKDLPEAEACKAKQNL